VVAAVAAVGAMLDAGEEPARPLEVIVFTSEEGSRFGIGLMGSTALVHGLSEEQLGRADDDGVTVAEALAEMGGDVDQVRSPWFQEGDRRAFIEVHIEQAAALEQRRVPVGVVTGIAAPVFVAGTIVGLTDHAGATPMEQRRDAFAGLAAFVLEAERAAADTGTTVATVGKATVLPGSMNAIPGQCEFTLDLRDLDLQTRDRVEDRLHRELERICTSRNLQWRLETLQRETPVHSDPEIRQVLEESVAETGTEVVTLPSGAAHDTMVMAQVCPVGMLFVRCRDGLSHTPDEHAEPADVAVAASALARALVRLG
jgi:allantoate deiminase